jgi:prepilin-type processing-associated H-X9-DG protein
MYKIIGADQKVYGPVPADQIKAWIKEGRLAPSSKVQAEGSTDWKELAQVPELAEALPERPVPPPGPGPGAPSPFPAGAGNTSGLAIASLVLGIIGLFLCGIGEIVGLVLGIVALVKINQSGGALRGRGLAIAGIVLSGLSFALLPAVMLMPALTRAKAKAQSITCMNHMKQLGLGLMMYSSDNQNQWPAADKWCDAISHSVGSEATFKCLAGPPGQRCHYAFNARLSGLPVNQIREPMRTVLAFETEGGWNQAGGQELVLNRPRHLGTVGVLFADGHVEMVRMTRLQSLRWDP